MFSILNQLRQNTADKDDTDNLANSWSRLVQGSTINKTINANTREALVPYEISTMCHCCFGKLLLTQTEAPNFIGINF